MTSTENSQDVILTAPSPKPIRIWRAYLWIWLSALLPLAALHVIIRPGGIKVYESLFAGVANLFGPYATYVLLPIHAPNAGEFHVYFLLPTRVITAAMIAILALPLLSRQRWMRICCLVIFVPILLYWLWLGLWQIGCMFT